MTKTDLYVEYPHEGYHLQNKNKTSIEKSISYVHHSFDPIDREKAKLVLSNLSKSDLCNDDLEDDFDEDLMIKVSSVSIVKKKMMMMMNE